LRSINVRVREGVDDTRHQMKVWVFPALLLGFSGVWAAMPVDAGPCPRDKSRNCFDVPATINFSSVPEISNKIVSEEKIQQKPLKNPAQDPATSTPYTGPMIGINPRPGRTPTVGYYWSLE
jgi:hypothetical protein